MVYLPKKQKNVTNTSATKVDKKITNQARHNNYTFINYHLLFLNTMSDCLTYAIHYLSKYPKTIHDMQQLLRKK